LAEIRLPAPPAGAGAAFERFGLKRGSAIAVASAAALVVIDGGVIANARIALGAVAPVPLLCSEAPRALIGEPPGDEVFARAGERAAAEARPISDIRGSAEFRRRLVEVLTRRALARAAARAMESAG